MHRSRKTDRIFCTDVSTLLLMVLGVVSAPGVAAAVSSEGESLTRAERRQLWSEDIEIVKRFLTDDKQELLGDFVVSADVGEKVAGWYESYREQYETADKARQEDLEKYIGLSKKYLSEGKVREALVEANRAKSNAVDKEAFLESDWLRDVANAAVEKANGYRSEHKWTKAHGVFYDLTALFEDNKEYKQARLECLNIARLNIMYGPSEDEGEDGEEDADAENRWHEVLVGIDKENVKDAFAKINRYYVESAEFGKMAASGLERLLLLCEAEKIRDTFTSLQDESLRKEFQIRIGKRLENLRGRRGAHAKSITYRDAQNDFLRAYKINQQTLQIPEEVIVYEYMIGALDELDDFTSMIWPAEIREFNKHTRGSFVGVGISISGGRKTPITVVSPLEDAPAYRAGILAGDEITHVDGQELKNISLNKAVKMITGPIDTEVTLTIHRPTEKRTFDVTLTRATVEIVSVKGLDRDPEDPERWNHMIDRASGIAYARVLNFQGNTVDQLHEVIDRSIAQGAKGFILDLRFNPGGLMSSAIDMAQLFLNREDLVVSTKGEKDAPWRNPAPDSDGEFTDLPLIVLVNEYSASASEIVSGALQDHHRAIILGERTFGKFSVQKLMRLRGADAHLKLTTARYYLPSGREFHHEEGRTEWGVSPDVEVALVPKEIVKVRLLQRKRDVLGRTPELIEKDTDKDKTAEANEDDGEKDVAASEDDTADGKDDGKDEDDALADADEDDDDDDRLDLEPDPNERPEIDRQLDTAVLLMRLHLLGEAKGLLAAAVKNEPSKKDVRNP